VPVSYQFLCTQSVQMYTIYMTIQESGVQSCTHEGYVKHQNLKSVAVFQAIKDMAQQSPSKMK
jgi:hypothetical protein